MLRDRVEQLTSRYFEEYQKIRQHLHAHPELSYQEYNTSAFVQSHLKELGIPFTVMAETGVVGILKGKTSERVIALRADMDALPIQEENDVPYASKVKGVMHACGHDVHTSCLLGAARILNELKEDWHGTVKLIFQPGEERNPGGASYMIRDGVLENPKPTAIYGMHVHPQLEVGKVGLRSGMVMASADELYVTIRGKGGHAAKPYLTADTILTASQIIVSLQQVVSRNSNPFSPSVLSICAIEGGHTTNVIPSEVKLMGTFRAMDEQWRYEAHKRIKEIVDQVGRSMGADTELRIDVGYPAVTNDPLLHQKAVPIAQEWMQPDNVVESELSMGAEDFGYYSQQIPGCFIRLGTGNKSKGIISGVHTPTFDIDEQAIKTGMGMMTFFGIRG